MLILSLIVVGCTKDEKVFGEPLPSEEYGPWGENVLLLEHRSPWSMVTP